MKETYKRSGNVLRVLYRGIVKQKHNTVFLMHRENVEIKIEGLVCT